MTQENPSCSLIDGETHTDYLGYAAPFHVEEDVSPQYDAYGRVRQVTTYVIRNAEGVGLGATDDQGSAELIVAALDYYAKHFGNRFSLPPNER